MKYRIMTVSVQSAVIISGYRPYQRVEMIADEGSFEEWDEDLVGNNPSALCRIYRKAEDAAGKNWFERGGNYR